MIRYISRRDVENLIEQLRNNSREADAQKLEDSLETAQGDKIAQVLHEVS